MNNSLFGYTKNDGIRRKEDCCLNENMQKTDVNSELENKPKINIKQDKILSIKYILTYFVEMRKEINLRLKKHDNLISYKVTVIGSLLVGFLYILDSSNYNISFYHTIFLYVLPIFSAIFDLSIASNLETIRRIGMYILEYIEKPLKNFSIEGFLGWETIGARPDSQWACFSFKDLLSVWSITFVIWLINLFYIWVYLSNFLGFLLYSIPTILTIYSILSLNTSIK